MRCALTLVLVFLTACSDSTTPDPPAGPSTDDTTAPAAVSDLEIVSYDVGQLTVAWTAPGDDDDEGSASEYRIGYDASMITDATWAACAAVFAPPTPANAGTRQTSVIDAPPYPDAFVALQSVDDAGNWSPLSNVAHAHVAGAYEVVQLTFDGSNRDPCLSDGFVTWVGWTEGGDEIFIAGLHGATATPTKLTDNGGEKEHPSSHGNAKIVWQGREGPGEDWEIFVYSYTAVPRYRAHTDDEIHDRSPVLAGGGNFAWQKGPPLYEEIHYWNESAHDAVPISHSCCPTDDYSNTRPVADDFTVVFEAWHRTGTEDRSTIRLWDGNLHDITEAIDGSLSRKFSLHAGSLAYEWGTGTPMIRLWDGTSVRDVMPGYSPSLDDGWIAYEHWDGHDWEIHLWDGVNDVQITDNDFDDSDPTLSGDRLAWTGRPSGASGFYQIYFAKLPPR